MRVKPTRVRWFSQMIFFALFLFLLLRTEFRGSLRAGGNEIRLPYPVQLFFQLDPLAAVSNALSSRALYHGLLWSLVILIPTMLLGRFFCGWICPLGSIHHFFGSLSSERKRGKQLIESNRYRRWQATKYYLLAGGLVAALLGAGVVGWLDPLSFLVRSLGLSILPATNYAVSAGLRVLAHSRWGSGFRGNVLHFLLGGWLLSFKQPHFRQGIWLGLIFVFLAALNFRIPGFGAGRFVRWALCLGSCRGGRFSDWSNRPKAAKTATGVCCDAKEETIRSGAFRGASRSVICA